MCGGEGGFVTRCHKYSLISEMPLLCFCDILHILKMRSSVDIIQYAHGFWSNITDQIQIYLCLGTEFLFPLTFPVDPINFARTHIVLSSVTVTVLPLTPCLNVCLCVKYCKCLHVDWLAVNCRNVILLVLARVFISSKKA